MYRLGPCQLLVIIYCQMKWNERKVELELGIELELGLERGTRRIVPAYNNDSYYRPAISSVKQSPCRGACSFLKRKNKPRHTSIVQPLLGTLRMEAATFIYSSL
jgi:hypothetical protein